MIKNIKIILSIIIAAALLLHACGRKSIEPEEYFSFYADGEYFNIPQESGWSFGGETKTLEAYKVGLTSYKISARIREYPLTIVSLEFSGAHIPDEDTVILSSASILNFKEQFTSYGMYAPLSGKIIFSERSSAKLTGTFEFEAFHINYDGFGGREITDTIIKITNGKFSIIPTN